ncbi:MAG: outer membrane beta-barrel protein [Stagnimonas sp.]|nr:outer membrane beta-barrel protein [Stagnimonas sp.]
MRHPLLAGLLLALPLSAVADGFSYTYADARYGFSDADATTAQAAGPVLSGALALPELYGISSLYLLGGLSYLETDNYSDGGVSGKLAALDAGLRLGTHHALTPGLDLFGNAGLAYANTEGKGGFSGYSDDDLSYLIELGLRAQLIERLELAIGYDFTGLRNDTTGSFSTGLEYRITPHISVVGAAEYASHADGYTVGGRYNF